MKYLIYIGGLGLLLALSGCQPREENRNSLLWKVSGNGSEEPSYLFGVWHAMCEEEFYLPEKAVNALYKSKSFVTESNMYYSYYGMDTVGNTDLISQLDSQMIQDIKRIMLPEFPEWKQYYQKSKPIYLAMGVGYFVNPCDNYIYYEDSLLQLIADKDIGWSYLEEMNELYDIFEGIPESHQLEILQYMVEDFSSIKSDIIPIWYSTYQHEVIDSMYLIVSYGNEIVNKDHENPELNEAFQAFGNKLITLRNENWIPKMSTKMERNSTFFAVGSAHLAGKNGLIHLLREEGYTVKPVY